MKIPVSVSRLVGRTVLQTKAKSPTLLFAAGVTGVVATVVLASRATLKLDRLLDTWEKEKLELEPVADKKDMLFFYARSAKELAVLYAPAIAVGAASVGCLTGAHNILSQRNVALTAAYAGMEGAFADYRKRVIDAEGDEADLKYRFGSQTVSESKLDSKGKVVVEELERPFRELKNPMYARFFDETCSSWNRRQDYNMAFLETQQTYWNQRLYAGGHVFLNEVYDSLGFERTPAGQIMGWIVSKDTDAHIDFGLFDDRNERARAFINGYESAILLDFNVTNIYERI